MKRCLLLVLLLLLVTLGASAEVSSNLFSQKKYNRHGQVTEMRYVNAQGETVTADNLGYAIARYEYNTYRQQTKVSYFDVDGNPVNCTDGYHSFTTKINAKRIVVERNYKDVDGNYVIGPDGYARQTLQYYGKWHEVTNNYDAEGSLVNAPYATYKTLYFSQNTGRTKNGDEYRDAEGNLMVGPEGYAYSHIDYWGNKDVRTAYYDPEGNLAFNTKVKYALQERTLDRGRYVKDAWYDESMNYTAGPSGYAYVEYEYPEPAATTYWYYNADGTPFWHKDGYCGKTVLLGPRNREQEVRYFGAEHERILCSKGYSRVETYYTTFGGILKQYYFDENDDRMIVEDLGYHMLVRTYNGKKVSTEYYLDVNQKPVNCVDGYHKISYGYTSRKAKDKAVAEIYTDVDGNPVPSKKGYSSIEYENDTEGHHIAEWYFDEQGQPYVMEEAGATEVHYEYEDGRVVLTSYYLNGQPVLTPKGYHQIMVTYNSAGKVLNQDYLDTQGAPVNTTDGYAHLANDYTGYDDIGAVRYTDAEDRLVLTPGQAYAYTLKEYGDSQRVYTLTYMDTEEKPFTVSAGYARIYRELDKDNSVILERYLDEDGRPVANTSGICTIRRTYEEKRLTSEAYFDAEDKPFKTGNGYARYTRAYTKDGDIAEEAYFDETGAPVLQKNGYAKVVREWDKAKVLHSETYFGVQGEKVENTSGYASFVYENDEQGNAVVIRYYGADGKPAEISGGYAVIRREFDENRRVVSEAWFDAGDQPT
ncbi:MAG: hypothetical protein IJI38_01355, partial [Clostridia bacterium]|nr:hypothetical protein [Clostridia bacterium]